MKQSDVLKLSDGKHLAEKGLFLLVRNGGRSRAWIYSRRVNGKYITRGLGSAYQFTLAMAKAAAEKLHAQILTGSLPEKAKAASAKRTFGDCYMEAIEAKQRTAKWRNSKHAQQWVNTVKTYAVPVLKSLEIDEITAKDILTVLNPIWEKKTETAKRLRARLETIFDYFIRQHWRTKANPAVWQANLEFDLPSPNRIRKIKHHGAPTLGELQFAIPLLMMDGVVGKATIFGIPTATRVQEFCMAEWKEIDFQRRVWSIPPERRKDGKDFPHQVPLSRQAVELLLSLRRRAKEIFPGYEKEYISLDSPRVSLQSIIIRKAKKPPVTMHGCRSTFRDWAAEKGKDIMVAEKCLMHEVGGSVYQAYQRSDLLESRRQLLQDWADEVMKLYKLIKQRELKPARSA